MTLVEVGIAALAGVAFAIVVMRVLYRAMSNLIDWLILTFGNDEAVARRRERRRRTRDE